MNATMLRTTGFPKPVVAADLRVAGEHVRFALTPGPGPSAATPSTPVPDL